MSKDIRIEAYRPEQAAAWDAFVAASNNGTLFHTQAFLGYHEGSTAQGFRHLMFHRGGKLAAVLPLGADPAGDGREWRSPFGASFGGLVTGDTQFAHHQEMIGALLLHAESQGIRRIRITPAPWCYHRQPDAALDFLLLRNGFRAETRELCQAIDLTALPPDPSSAYAYACDKQIRKAERLGMEVRPLEDLDAFHAMLVENRARHGVAPTHALDQLTRLRGRIPGAFHLFGAFRGGALEAATLAFAANPRALLNFYTCHRDEASGTGAANLVNHHVIRWAREQGFRYYDFGTSTLRMEPNEGLIRFKESFGGGAVLRDAFLWEAP